MVEKSPAGVGQFDAAYAAAHQRDADLVFEIADLAAEGRLRRVQLFLSREREAALLGDRDEVAKVPQLHGIHISKACPPTYKVFFATARGSYFPHNSGCSSPWEHPEGPAYQLPGAASHAPLAGTRTREEPENGQPSRIDHRRFCGQRAD